MLPIFILVGPPAVGKSTTSRVLANHFSKSIHISVDDIRTMVVSGLQLPSAEWSDELTQQIHLARRSVSYMAKMYHQAQFAVVIDDFWDVNLKVDYQEMLSLTFVHKVILYPTQEEAHARNLKRSGDSPARGYIDEGIRIVYGQLSPVMPQLQQENWSLINTTELTVDETVQTILHKVEK